MARFDEFRESLLEAGRYLELAISYLEEDALENGEDEDCGEDLYGETHDAVISADSELNEA